jgi:hypothetical protein
MNSDVSAGAEIPNLVALHANCRDIVSSENHSVSRSGSGRTGAARSFETNSLRVFNFIHIFARLKFEKS